MEQFFDSYIVDYYNNPEYRLNIYGGVSYVIPIDEREETWVTFVNGLIDNGVKPEFIDFGCRNICFGLGFYDGISKHFEQ